MSMSLTTPRVLGDVLPGGVARDVGLVVGGAALTGVAAQIAVPLPFTPIPLTLQTFAVLLVGASLGTVRGVASMLLYAVAGTAGLPLFAEGGSGYQAATFGYVLGFILAAALVGRLAERAGSRRFSQSAVLMTVGTVAIYAMGVPWLMVSAHLSLLQALTVGVVPFVVGDVLKAVVAVSALPTAWRLLGR